LCWVEASSQALVERGHGPAPPAGSASSLLPRRAAAGRSAGTWPYVPDVRGSLWGAVGCGARTMRRGAMGHKVEGLSCMLVGALRLTV
jgi:hypothetical protein